MDKIIKLENVSKIYNIGQENEVKALVDISLEIKKGEFVAIMGPSGSGKSTGMNLIGSLDVPTSGKIFLDGKNILHLSESGLAQLRGKKIGFIFQSFNLIPNLTSRENVVLPMIFQNIDEFKRNELAGKLLNMIGLGDRMDHYPGELSGGQQQRVAIARSLANDPEVILADEPTGNLDTQTGKNVIEFLKKLNKQGKTIVIITHDSDVALKYSKKIYWIVDGKIKKVTKKRNGKWVNVK